MTLEVVSALARHHRAGLSANSVAAAVEGFDRLPLIRHASAELIADAWSLRESLRVADAFYVALARELQVSLITSDARLGRAVRQQALCDVVVVE